jgi:acetoin utilization deacetylase AcuC-like enzyme
MAAPVYLRHASSLGHDMGRHPERPARIEAIERELATRDWIGFERAESPAAERASLLAVHGERHVAAIEQLAGRGGGMIDADTALVADSLEAALHAAGGAIALVDLLMSGAAPCGASVHRPPGHHAEAERAMGFCLFNNVAVAAAHARSSHDVERVLVLDWDVHHGNGTNDIFHASPAVLFCSIHQSPLYPGTGPAGDVGSGEGMGYTLNMPVPPGSGDEVFCSLVEHVVVPLARAYEPQLVLISAGFDAHADDPLADCRVTDAGYARMAGAIALCARELSAPCGLVLEGGYALAALARGVAAALSALASPQAHGDLPVAPHARAARERLAAHWPAFEPAPSG